MDSLKEQLIIEKIATEFDQCRVTRSVEVTPVVPTSLEMIDDRVDNLPAVTVFMESSELLQEQNGSIDIGIVVAFNVTQEVTDSLHQDVTDLKGELYAILMRQRQTFLGYQFVLDLRFISDEGVDREPRADIPLYTREHKWAVRYRTKTRDITRD